MCNASIPEEATLSANILMLPSGPPHSPAHAEQREGAQPNAVGHLTPNRVAKDLEKSRNFTHEAKLVRAPFELQPDQSLSSS